ncbi:MAG: sigma factor-like helix-turn-helix DNA-binding protein [Candidatus Aenigmatarchaeota archaeon]
MKELLYKTYEDLFSDLEDKDAFIIKKKFGIENETEETFASIGRNLNLTRERVRQLYNKIIQKLKSKLTKTRDFNKVLIIVKENFGKLHIKREKYIIEKLSINYSLNEEEKKIAKLIISILPEYYYHKETNLFYSFISHEKFFKKTLKILEKINIDLKRNKKIWNRDEFLKSFSSYIKESFNINPDIDDIFEFAKILKTLGKNPLDELGYIKHKRITPSSLEDKIYLVFKLERRPLHFTEIYKKLKEISEIEDDLLHEKWKKNYTPQTILTVIKKDKKFVWYGRGTYALREDGYKDGKIIDLMKEIVKKNNGIKEEKLFEIIQKHKKVSPNTFKLYITKFFNKIRDSIYLK